MYCMLIIVKVLENIFFAERVVSLWNSLRAGVDFTSLHRLKHSLLEVDCKKFLTINVDG